jgi:hypothetical protein
MENGRMEAIIETAKVENIVKAKLQHSLAPLSMGIIMECPDLKGVAQHRIKHQIDMLKREGKVRTIPMIFPGRTDRVGYEWVKSGDAKPELPKPVQKLVDEVRLKINDDHSITITTPKIRVTIEVPK